MGPDGRPRAKLVGIVRSRPCSGRGGKAGMSEGRAAGSGSDVRGARAIWPLRFSARVRACKDRIRSCRKAMRGRWAGFGCARAEIVCAESAGRSGAAGVHACARREDACGSGRHGGLSSIGSKALHYAMNRRRSRGRRWPGGSGLQADCRMVKQGLRRAGSPSGARASLLRKLPSIARTNQHLTTPHEIVEDIGFLLFRMESGAVCLELQHRNFLIISI